MLSDEQYETMRKELEAGLVELCKQCDRPLVDSAKLDFDNPNKCPCRCSKVNGMREALHGMINTLNPN